MRIDAKACLTVPFAYITVIIPGITATCSEEIRYGTMFGSVRYRAAMYFVVFYGKVRYRVPLLGDIDTNVRNVPHRTVPPNASVRI